MSVGLIALLDDVAALAKVAAASLDDVAGQAAHAGVKAAGVVIDDAAVTPRYVAGFSPAREVPIVARIALGSLRNKLLFLLPIALALGFFAPWLITPLLMLGGAYLSYEGVEKIVDAWGPAHRAPAGDDDAATSPEDPRRFEDEKVAGAIRTDFILSAEIMAITLAAVPEEGFVGQAVVLAVVGTGITVLVYGGVALIVKADDAGLALARLAGDGPAVRLLRLLGRGLVRSVPFVMTALSVIGTAAMIWVGGGIILHGLDILGLEEAGDTLHAVEAVAQGLPSPAEAVVGWLAGAALSGIAGLVVGGAMLLLVRYGIEPAWSTAAAVGRRLRAR